MVKIIRLIPMIIFIFLAVFSPPILPFNSIYILALISAIGIIFHKSNKIVIGDKNLLAKCSFFAIYVFLIIFLNIITGDNDKLLTNRIIVLYQLYILIPFQFIVSSYIVRYFNARKNEDSFWIALIASGLLETLCVVLSFLSPTIRNMFLDSILSHGGLERVYANQEVLLYRGFGWADTLLDTFGYGMGIYAGLCLLNRRYGKRRLIVVLPFIFSTMLNSRTGIAIFMIAVMVWVIGIIKRGNVSQFVRIVFVIVIALAAIVVLVNSGIIGTETLSWIHSGFRSVWNLFTGRKEEYSVGSMQNSLLSKRFWILPGSILGIVFGVGHSVFGTREIIGINSDVGYINFIWISGLIGTVALLTVIYHWFNRVKKVTIDYFEKEIVIFLMISFYVMFIKGNVISHTAGTFLTILVITFYYSKNKMIMKKTPCKVKIDKDK